ncbi:MAG: hypothetical protein ACREP7_23200 [Lysobacter sp.]
MQSSFRTDLAACVLATLIGVLAFPSSQAASLDLNKLSACEDVAYVMNELESSDEPFSDQCRLPKTEFERVLVAKQVAMPGAKYCFMDLPKVPSLSGFGCIQTSYESSHGLVCFRPVDGDLIPRYRDDYTSSHEADVRAYLQAASDCKGTNGDSSVDASIIVLPFLVNVARAEFGYRVSIGQGQTTDKYVQHGVAGIDPALAGRIPQAVEYVNYVTGAKFPEADHAREKVRFDDKILTFSRNDLAELTQMKLLKQANLKMSVLEFALERKPLSGPSTSGQTEILNGVRSDVRRFLLGERFQKMSDEKLRSISGLSAADHMKKLQDNLPYGTRAAVTGRLDYELEVYFNEAPGVCPGSGAVMANLMLRKPRERSSLDLGDVAIQIMGIGDCGESRAADKYLKGLEQGVIEAAEHALGIEID